MNMAVHKTEIIHDQSNVKGCSPLIVKIFFKTPFKRPILYALDCEIFKRISRVDAGLEK